MRQHNGERTTNPGLGATHFTKLGVQPTVNGGVRVTHLLGSRVGPQPSTVSGSGELARCFILLEGPPSLLGVVLCRYRSAATH